MPYKVHQHFHFMIENCYCPFFQIPTTVNEHNYLWKGVHTCNKGTNF